MSASDARPRAVVERFLAAYNAKDLQTIAALLHEDVTMVHLGTPIDLAGRDAVCERLAQSAQGVFPDRRFDAPRRLLDCGEHVVVEHDWRATAAADAPGMAKAGERVTMRLCTIFTVRDGAIAEYTEYG